MGLSSYYAKLHEVNPRSVYRVLEETVRLHGDAVALRQPFAVAPDGYLSYSWNNYKKAVDEIAAGLRSLGIEKGKSFQPDARTQALLNAGATEARAWLEHQYSPGFAPFYSGSHWGPPANPVFVEATQSGYANPDSYPVDARGVTYSLGFTGIKRLGTAQFYLMANRDRAGQELDGTRTYRLRIPVGVPVRRYWSVTVYDRATHALIRNLPYSSRSSQTATKNADGTVDVFFGPKAPTGKEASWVPTNPSGKFELLFRAYGPEPAFFEKTWRLPDVERID